MSDRPFRVLGVQQVAVGGLDREALRRLWIETFGLSPGGYYKSEAENVDGEIAIAGAGPFRVDINLLQPIDPERSPRVHKPPLNHVGLWVDDLRAAVEWLKAQGIGFTSGEIRPGAAGHDACFIHPKQGGEGVLIELQQAPPAVIEAFRRLQESGD